MKLGAFELTRDRDGNVQARRRGDVRRRAEGALEQDESRRREQPDLDGDARPLRRGGRPPARRRQRRRHELRREDDAQLRDRDGRGSARRSSARASIRIRSPTRSRRISISTTREDSATARPAARSGSPCPGRSTISSAGSGRRRSSRTRRTARASSPSIFSRSRRRDS